MLLRAKSIMLISACVLACSANLGFADTDTPTFGEDPALWGEEEKVYTATKFITQLKKAPVVATVITDQQIENMGARTILDVLKHVPGIAVSIDRGTGFKNISSRGAKVNYSTNVLILIDGHKVNDVYYGSGVLTYFDYPVGLIKRIEVIRSPGSALYGAGAFSAVINIITKENIGVNSVTFNSQGGTHNYYQDTALVTYNFDELKIRGYVNYAHSDSRDLFVKEDAGLTIKQSGYTLDFYDRYDINIKANYRDFTATFSYMKNDFGPYIGVASVLNDETIQRHRYAYVDLAYSKWMSENLQTIFRVYYDRKLYRTNWELYPSEAPFPGWTTSMYGQPHGEMGSTGVEAQIDYTLTEDSLFTLGLNYETQEIYDATSITNFDPNTFDYLGGLQDVTETGNYTKITAHYISAVYAQNIWYITPRLNWTLGARLDKYSNFGETINPRAALVWNPSQKSSAKLIYGTAFRAPTFLELYIINNPIATGNEDLKPEKNKTYELSLNHEFDTRFSGELNFFYSEIRDLITQVPTGVGNRTIYENKGGINIEGVEVELKARKDIDNYAYVNYTFQNPRDSETDELHVGISRHLANAGINAAINNHVNVNSNISASGRRSRASTDDRPPLDKYVVVDASVILKNYTPGIQMQITAHNLFDKTYFDPDETGAVYYDFPREGRTLMIGVKIVN